MDRKQFDAATRLFASKQSRRAAIVAFVGATLFGQDPESIEAAQDVEAEHHRRRRRRNRRRNRNRDRCKQSGQFPSAKRPCCQGLVLDPTGRCAECASCLPGQRCVTGQCVCDSRSCPTGCCTSVGTPGGTCQPGTDNDVCGNGGFTCTMCLNPTPVCVGQVCGQCSASNLCRSPNRCCDTATGTCQPGTENTACGPAGGVCGPCPAATPRCVNRVCVV
jgi:hypothetical protein